MFNLSHSQNFLRSSRLVRALVQRSSLTKEDVVLDIGAGDGILTEELALRSKRVEAIEKDLSLCTILKNRFAEARNVNVHCGNVLQYALPLHSYKVFANIPYTLTAAIMRKLFDATNPPTDAYLIMQREAAQKYAGRPYGPETLVSLIRKPWFDFRILHTFRKTDFHPVPAVTSVLVRTRKRKHALVSDENKMCYQDFIAYGFLSNKSNLKKTYAPIFGYERFKRLARELRFSIAAKPTDISFEQWLKLFSVFMAVVPVSRRHQIAGAWQALIKQQARISKQHRTTAKNLTFTNDS